MKEKWGRPVITILGIEQTESELKSIIKAECKGYYPGGECKLPGTSTYTNGDTFTTADPGYQSWRAAHAKACKGPQGADVQNWEPVLYWVS